MFIKDRKIAIIGPYPPPYGGISVHIKRVLSYLNKDDYIFLNQSKTRHSDLDINSYYIKRYFKALRFFFYRYKLIHQHSPDKYMRLLLCFVGLFNNNVYLHIHGTSLKDTLNKKSLLSLLLKGMLKYVHILASNDDIVQLVRKYKPRSIQEIDAYLPPKFEEHLYLEFIDKIGIIKSDVIITTVGWFSKYNNEYLYGFDILLEALKILSKKNEKTITIIASVNGITNKELYSKFINKRKAYKLEKQFILLEKDFEEIWPLYIYGDIFVRATNTDGSSVSVKEALWAESCVIASDAVSRPKGVRLFKNRDVNELVNKISVEISKEFINKDQRINKIKSKTFSSKLFKEIYNVE